ncbi:MAG: transglutaminase domain-containing protein [Bacteroidetes bacterium]|nr:transglutaminase domain-containing protein [Bacteroidota bacterium]
MKEYLKPAEFIDSGSEEVKSFTRKFAGSGTEPVSKAVNLYYAVRDGFYYDPYTIDFSREAVKASSQVTRKYGFCISKACLLAAAARASGIPSRLAFANVRNHIATEKLEKLLQTDVMVFHGYTELFLNNRWIKATPAFNKSLCEKLNVEPLEFDGKNNSLFQQYDKTGKKFMEYVHDYGNFPDVPLELFISELSKHYPHLFSGNKRMKEYGVKWKGIAVLNKL